MGKISNFAATEMLDHLYKAAYTPSATLYLALCTAATSDTSTGSTITEADYSGYARKSFSGASVFGAAATRKVVQEADIEFAQAEGVSTSDITHWAICDAATNGNVLAQGVFNSAWNVVNGSTPKVASSEIEIAISASSGAGLTNYATHKLLDLVFRNQAYTSPNGSIHFGLTTATLTDASTSGTEPTGNGYAREPVPNTSFDAALIGVNTTNTDIVFDSPTGLWGTITSQITMDALTGGNMLAYDNTNVVDQEVNSNSTVKIAAGNFSQTID